MLAGFRIIEIEGLGPAPFAGMLFADLGAEVIVVHRSEPPFSVTDNSSLLDRGKKSIILDLKNAADVATLNKLIATADGLIEGFRPGVMERLGLGPDDVHSISPQLVYGRLTGWGQDGPFASSAGHDLNYIGLSGALWFASQAGDAPLTPPTLVGDIGGGAMYLVAGMLAGLLQAQKTGRGTVVDAAIVDGSAHMMNLQMTAQAVGMLSDSRGTSILDGSPWSRCYQCADGGWLAVQCLEPQFYTEFCDKLGLDKPPRQDPNPANWPPIAQQFAEIIGGKTIEQWSSVFAGSDACVAPVLSPSQSASHPHMSARGIWAETDGQLQARAAPRFDGQRPEDPAAPPLRGQHTAEILEGLMSG